jgi:hypothetical protein
LPTVSTEFGDREEERQSNARDWRFVALVVLKMRAEGNVGMLDLTFIDKLGFHLEPSGTPNGQTQKSSHGAGPVHLLQDGDEEADLHLGRML